MQVIFDNIVFSLQRCGGISMVWANLVSRVLAKMNGVSFIEYQNSNDNICRQNLDLGNNNYVYRILRLPRRYDRTC